MKNKTEEDIEYLEENFPKGETKFRGEAMVLLALARKQGEKQRNVKVEQAIEDIDLELMLTDIKDKKGNKVELSDEFMDLISIWWEKTKKELLQKLGLENKNE